VQAGTFGVRTEVLQENLSHKQINEALGLDGAYAAYTAYTAAVEAFIGSLDPALRRLLAPR
jgi:hypothetical protein